MHVPVYAYIFTSDFYNLFKIFVVILDLKMLMIVKTANRQPKTFLWYIFATNNRIDIILFRYTNIFKYYHSIYWYHLIPWEPSTLPMPYTHICICSNTTQENLMDTYMRERWSSSLKDDTGSPIYLEDPTNLHKLCYLRKECCAIFKVLLVCHTTIVTKML